MACRLDINNDRSLQIDQVVVGVGKESVAFVSPGPLRGRIGSRDKLRHRLARCTPSRFIQRVEVLADGPPRPGKRVPVMVLSPHSGALLVGVGSDQAGIDGEGRSIDQPLRHAA